MVASDRLMVGFRLGGYHIEPRIGRVTGEHGHAHLPPKAMSVLLRLCGQPLAVVSRKELLHHAWGDGEGNHERLSHAISEIRQALGDHMHEPRFIETVPKHGYRLLVAPTFEPIASSEDTTTQADPSPRRSLLGELKRRGVIETGVAYLVLGWLLIQVAAVTFQQLSLPPSAPTFVTYLVIVGFPIALVLAWFIELTPQGMVLDIRPNTRPAPRSFGKHYVSILCALAVASTGVFFYDRYFGLPTEGARAALLPPEEVIDVDPNSIAVLPFLNISGSEEGDVFSAGLSEDMIDVLTRVPGLHVASRGDSFSLAPNALSRDVRRRLRVAYYLEGSVRIMAHNLRVVVQLIDSADGKHLFSRRFDRPWESFFALQDEITQLVVANLRVALPTLSPPSIRLTAETASFDAYLQYRRGMAILYRPLTSATIEEALDAFDASLGVDPDYAAAYAGICLTYTSGYSVMREPEYIEQAEHACAAALGRSPNLIVVHNALGDLYRRTGRYQEAERAFERALAIHPNDVPALMGLADIYSSQQRLHEAEQRYRQAVGLQPGNWSTYNALGRFLYGNGRYVEAAEAYRAVVAVDSGNATGWTNLATSLMLSGDFAAATLAFEHVLEMEPRPTTYVNRGLLHYYLGETDEARVALEEAVQIAPQYYVAWSNFGDVLMLAGDPEGAIDAFTEAERLARQQLDINRRDAEIIIDLAWITAMLGRLGEAEELIATALDVAPTDPYVHYIDALVHARMGDPGAALDRLEAAAGMGYPRALIRAEPHLAALRDQARFVALVGE